jgi:hypothetical protein
MSEKKLLVNLDAMIKRADFAQTSDSQITFEKIPTISIRDFSTDGLVGNNLRKPDFQRETNHWTPNQVLSLLECFLNGDLIPSVILWQSQTFLFVIDGGHRLSVLKAWVEDDYGDGPSSVRYFGDSISGYQKKAAERTRKLVSDTIGSYQHIKTRIENSEIDKRALSVMTRGLPIQWVDGDAEKAENSFFKINTQGTPLDEIEEALLRNRKRPIAISARAIIRAGKGHKYWSRFNPENTQVIEGLSKSLHKTLFDPEMISPIKTLDLPLGGSKGIRSALQILIDYISVSCRSQSQRSISIDYGNDDEIGEETIEVLKKALRLGQRMTGNDKGSLGLHPAVYYYGPTGVHSSPMFLGTALLINEKLAYNDSDFFKYFTDSREAIENTLITNKELIATILQKMGSRNRIVKYKDLLNSIYTAAKENSTITEGDLVSWAGLEGKIIVGQEKSNKVDFSDEAKSKIFIYTALKNHIKCPICKGYLDTSKSVSYDHIKRVRDGGSGDADNGQITHPYCNQSIRN